VLLFGISVGVLVFWSEFGASSVRYVFEFCLCGHSRLSKRFWLNFWFTLVCRGFSLVRVLI